VIGWLDCSAGVSGDMLLGCLLDAGVGLDLLQSAVDTIGVEPVRLTQQTVTRGGIGAVQVDVEVDEHPRTRTWADVRGLVEAADLPSPVAATALDVFARLAAAEAAVHRTSPDAVHFHEVGALDAVADVVGGAAGLHALGLSRLTAGPVVLGSGTTRGAHGPLPVPPPAVLALLAGAPVLAGPVAKEMTTPTGAALLAATVEAYGPLPPMVLRRTGTGAGGRDPAEVANVLRLVVGDTGGGAPTREDAVVLEANVDDLDPRLWPGVLQELLDAGASDAWLTPILMKKGRPAHTLHVLCPPGRTAAVHDVVFRSTTTLGVRSSTVVKHALARTERTVDVDGRAVRVKLGLLGEEVVNAVPEWEDVAAAAAALGRPAKLVLGDAVARAAELAARPVSGSRPAP
jgi:pyridinium-3,5-bisthiocarboxylic acid mononucleotide nickel chelatase